MRTVHRPTKLEPFRSTEIGRSLPSRRSDDAVRSYGSRSRPADRHRRPARTGRGLDQHEWLGERLRRVLGQAWVVTPTAWSMPTTCAAAQSAPTLTAAPAVRCGTDGPRRMPATVTTASRTCDVAAVAASPSTRPGRGDGRHPGRIRLAAARAVPHGRGRSGPRARRAVGGVRPCPARVAGGAVVGATTGLGSATRTAGRATGPPGRRRRRLRHRHRRRRGAPPRRAGASAIVITPTGVDLDLFDPPPDGDGVRNDLGLGASS